MSTTMSTQTGAMSAPSHPVTVSPLLLADRLLGLAQDADQAGLRRPAADLVRLAFAMYDEKPFTYGWGPNPSA
jgi:hypothetical protein